MIKKINVSFRKFFFERSNISEKNSDNKFFNICGDHFPVNFLISINDLSEEDIENLAKFFNDWVSEIQTKKVFK